MTNPTDEEIMELMPQQMRDNLAAAARAMIGFDSPKVVGACRIILNRHAVDHVRAALAQWGRPTPQPVAASERLPGPKDCDEQGRCWGWRSFDPEVDDLGDFWLQIPCEWLGKCHRWTHWLPANAIPTPEYTND